MANKAPPNALEIGSVQLPLCVVFKVRLVAFGRQGKDLADPDAEPKFCVELDVIRMRPGDGTKRGRKGNRKLYYQPETRIFTKSPNGKKPVEDITNVDQVLQWVEEAIANLGNSN